MILEIGLVAIIACVAQAAMLGCAALRERTTKLTQIDKVEAAPSTWPPFVVLKPIVYGDEISLGLCKQWIDSARAYPGPAAVVFSTLAELRPRLEALVVTDEDVHVRIVSCESSERRKEPGLDKAHRLVAAEAAARDFLAGKDGVLLVTDEDVEPICLAVLENFVRAAPQPGKAVTVLYPIDPDHGDTHNQLVGANAQFVNSFYSAGATLLSKWYAMVLGWTVLVWSSDLVRGGGFAATLPYLTEDAPLGKTLARLGVKVRMLSGEAALRARERNHSWALHWRRQVRWRAHLAAAGWWAPPLTLVLVPFAGPVLWALVLGITQPGWVSLGIGVSALAVQRYALRLSWRTLWVAPIHEALAIAVQAVGCVSRRIRWGPWEYRIDADARIIAKRWRGDGL